MDILKFVYKQGDIILSSGQKSNYYFDFRLLCSDPPRMNYAVDLIIAEINRTQLQFDIICGVPMGAIPLATLLSAKTGKPFIMLRKERKTYGAKNIIEGSFTVGNICLIVDDVMTTGNSIKKCAETLRKEGLIVKNAVVLLSRGKNNQLNSGLTVHSSIDKSTLKSFLNRPKIKLGDIVLENPLMNASGCYCTSTKELDELLASSAAAVVTKSCTVHQWEGNPRPRYASDAIGSINSNGLCNMGLTYYLDWANGAKSQKPKIISVSGLDINEKWTLLSDVICTGNILEVNISCPNIDGGDFQKTLENMMRILVNLNMHWKPPESKIGLKLPPLFYPGDITAIGGIINKFKHMINYIVCSNSLPNGLFLANGKPAIVPRAGIGGVGGKYLKPIALSNVYQLRKIIDPAVAIVGCGGVSTGQDVRDYLDAGAAAVQIGTQLVEEGPGCFARILKELDSL